MVLAPIIMTLVLVVVIPVSVIMTGAVAAGLLGYFAKKDVDSAFEGTEHLELS